MVLRFLMRYLANNEKLIQRMAESYPMRRAAQLVVSMMYRAKSATKLEINPERLKSFIDMFKNNLKKEIDGAKDELKKKKF